MNEIKRACSYTAVIKCAIDPTEYTRILVTFSQDQQIVIEKTESQMLVSSDGIIVNLSQDETLQFRPTGKSVMGRRTGSPVYMQIRAYKSTYEAPGSKQFALEVVDCQSEEVLVNA